MRIRQTASAQRLCDADARAADQTGLAPDLQSVFVLDDRDTNAIAEQRIGYCDVCFTCSYCAVEARPSLHAQTIGTHRDGPFESRTCTTHSRVANLPAPITTLL